MFHSFVEEPEGSSRVQLQLEVVHRSLMHGVGRKNRQPMFLHSNLGVCVNCLFNQMWIWWELESVFCLIKIQLAVPILCFPNFQVSNSYSSHYSKFTSGTTLWIPLWVWRRDPKSGVPRPDIWGAGCLGEKLPELYFGKRNGMILGAEEPCRGCCELSLIFRGVSDWKPWKENVMISGLPPISTSLSGEC